MAKQKKKPVVELNDDINWDYDSEKKLYKFYTVQDIDPDQELTYFLN